VAKSIELGQLASLLTVDANVNSKAISVGSSITLNTNTGIVSATSFTGDASILRINDRISESSDSFILDLYLFG
jgi:hypothetical protein